MRALSARRGIMIQAQHRPRVAADMAISLARKGSSVTVLDGDRVVMTCPRAEGSPVRVTKCQIDAVFMRRLEALNKRRRRAQKG